VELLPEEFIGGTRFIRTRSFRKPRARLQRRDARVGVAYDLFGTGKTSLKFNAGKYVQPAQNAVSIRRGAHVRHRDRGTRSWTDTTELRRRLQSRDAGRVQPDASGGDVCGALSKQTSAR